MSKALKTSRFSGPSDAIDIERLERETQKLFFLGLLVAISFHASLGSYFMFRKTEIRVVKPPTMELVIRRPRMTKAFEFKKKRVQVRLLQRKQIVERKPTAEIQTKSIATVDLMGNVATFDYQEEMKTNVDTQVSIPDGIEIEMTATREPEKQISMKEEMISLDDLDTGQYKAMVIQDPNNKQSIKGFVYISTAWGAQLRPPDKLKRSVINLVEAVNRYTNINAKVDSHLYLDSRKIFESPFVFITADQAFELTDIEKNNFGNYLRQGGFAVIDNGTPEYEYGQAEASLRQMIRDSLGADAQFLPIKNDHPLYHCFFDFPDGAPQGAEIQMVQTATNGMQGIEALNAAMAKAVYYIEGIWLDERLVAIYSDKGYALKWKELTNNEPQLRMGVNFVVFALTQAGGIAQQKMDFFSAVQ
ncbi:MAG: DUF4159 domain-containing protein [Candidatus Latescibacteria bacterium]|nr:DUF4159 domain-containing protein [Candidatus Latescibacterota bacterium]